MPTTINIEPALFRWQAKYNRRLTYEELAQMAGISIAALYRMKSGEMITPDLRKINELCKVLECEPGEIIVREETSATDEITRLEVEHIEVLKEIERKIKSRKAKN